jgi:HSP20 family molecular chaperone IbpA
MQLNIMSGSTGDPPWRTDDVGRRIPDRTGTTKGGYIPDYPGIGFPKPPNTFYHLINSTYKAPADIPCDANSVGTQFIAVFNLGGVRKEDIDITVHPDRVEISATRSLSGPKSLSLYSSEVSCGKLRRTIPFEDTKVNIETAKADYDNGLVTLTMDLLQPKPPPAVKVEIK